VKKALSRDEQLKRLRIQAEKKYAQIRLVFCLLKALRPMVSYEQMCRDMPCISGGAFVLPTHHASDNSGWELADAVDDALIDELRAALRAGRLFGLAADTSVLIGNKDYMTIELYTVVGGRRAVFFCCLSEVGTRTNAVPAPSPSPSNGGRAYCTSRTARTRRRCLRGRRAARPAAAIPGATR